jgi:hypothetical protein
LSTTTDIKTAVQYSFHEDYQDSLVFKIVTNNALQRGADLQWLSAFPTEAEFLLPPLTYLQPTGKKQVIEVEGRRYTFVEVRPTYSA